MQMKLLRSMAALVLLSPAVSALAQGPETSVPLNDLSFFKPVSSNWQIAADVTADPGKAEDLRLVAGAGVLANLPDAAHREDIYSKEEFGDLDLEFDFVMAAHSNSGVYLQGRYEIQLLDSWGKKNPYFGDCGGVYERWNDAKPEGQQGFEGTAPRLNAAMAPGLWQHMKISFQAPRFDAKGNKIAHARVLSVELNGLTVIENVELTGPTRGAMAQQEVAKGPLRIQGDHGPVAFRNMKYRHYNQPPVTISNLSYRWYNLAKGDDKSGRKPDEVGSMKDLTWEAGPNAERYIMVISGSLKIPAEGTYVFEQMNYGSGSLAIDGMPAISHEYGQHRGSVKLSAGDHTFELRYAKEENWYPSGLGLSVEGPNVRRTALNPISSVAIPDPTDPIGADVGSEPYILRCFVDVTEGGKRHRITHAANVGSPLGAHFTINLDNGALVQSWRGPFMDATPMWHDRGDGSSVPAGAVQLLGDLPQVIQMSPDQTGRPAAYSEADGYRFVRYTLDAAGYPTFVYTVYGWEVTDKIIPDAEGKSLIRELSFAGSGKANTFFSLGRGSRIELAAKGLYAVNGRDYYLKPLLPAKAKPVMYNSNGQDEFLLPVSAGTIKYMIMW
ncbi:MAG: DUF1080 domain-containing protein [Bacteroidetes bacterium]|nr:MAG: DUF1080 domain-containing protein [Bacteroidota bacterium]